MLGMPVGGAMRCSTHSSQSSRRFLSDVVGVVHAGRCVPVIGVGKFGAVVAVAAVDAALLNLSILHAAMGDQ